jgi:hypothetical protein
MPCGDRDIFVGVATLSKITQLIISHLTQGNVATQFHRWELQKKLREKRLSRKLLSRKLLSRKRLGKST